MAAYPITDLVFAESENEVAQTKWKTLLVDKLNLPFELMQAGIDLGIYGNCIMGIYFPFNRYLVCPECGSSNTIKELKENSILKGIPEKILFKGVCPNCNSQVEFKIRDKYCGDINRIKLIRYDPLDITISYDPVSGNSVYMWDPPENYMVS